MPKRRYEMPGAASTEGEDGKPQDPKAGEGASPQDPEQDPKPQEGADGEGGKPQDPDTHEGDAVNRHQYDRDIERRDKEIAELREQVKAQNDAKAASGDATAKLRQELDEFKAQLASEKANTALTAAGCIDLELGCEALAKFDGDVAKLAEAKPYLFGDKDRTIRSTGGKPAGSATGPAKSIRDALRG